jgi:hypothetical protein
VTRTVSGAPKHAAGKQRSAERRKLALSARKLEALGLFIGLIAGLGAAFGLGAFRSPGHPASPGAASPGAASPGAASPGAASTDPPPAVRVAVSNEPDPAALDAEWADNSDRSTCADWAGGDGISAFRLNSTQLAWFFSDTFLGPASPTTGFSHLSGFIHNSVVIQTTAGGSSTFVTMTGGGACPGPGKPPARVTSSVVAPPLAPGPPGDRYWDADGIEIGGTIVKFYNEYLPGNVPYISAGTVIATFPVSQLGAAGHGSAYGAVARPALIPLPAYVPPAGGTPIVWGAAVLQTGSTVYIYGTQTPDPSTGVRELYLARAPVSQLTRFPAWRFYAGDGQWAAGQQDAQPVQPASSELDVSSGFSVVEISHRYWLIQAGAVPGSADINAYPAATPWGPFDPAAGILLYHDSDIGLDAADDYRIMYEARAEPALSTASTLVISYNVNSEAVTTGCVPISALTNTVTQPKFITVPMAAFGASGRYRAAAGPPDYPLIVQQDPAQWSDAWGYPDGCPPVPDLTQVQAQLKASAVTLTWPDTGLGLRYRVYLIGPGAAAERLATTTTADYATITGLSGGTYQARVVPVNIKQDIGLGALVTFTIPDHLGLLA